MYTLLQVSKKKKPMLTYCLCFQLQHIVMIHKGPFTQAIFVAQTRCDFHSASQVASSFKHVRNPCDIAATNRSANRTWFTNAILKLQL